jgi:hypothetical protein
MPDKRCEVSWTLPCPTAVLTPHGVRNAEDCELLDSWAVQQHALNLEGRDLPAAAAGATEGAGLTTNTAPLHALFLT